MAYLVSEQAAWIRDQYGVGDVIEPLRSVPWHLKEVDVARPGKDDIWEGTVPVRNGTFLFDRTGRRGPLRFTIGDDTSLEEIDTDELPLLTGYVATTPKAPANLILVSDSADPILAKWRYGLGRTVAFTPETKPRRAEDRLEWPDFAKFWSQLVRSVTGEDLAKAISIDCSHSLEDSGVALTADVRDSAGNFVTDLSLQLSALGSSGRTRQLAVERKGPGLFEARVPEITYGRDQQFAWRFLGEGQNEQTAADGFVYSFSPEFRTFGVADDVLERIMARGTGETVSVGESRLMMGDAAGTVRIPLWPYLLVAALLTVPLDILSRRLG